MMSQPGPVQNRILMHLPTAAFNLLQPHLHRVQLHRHEILQEQNALVRKVYFIESGIASMVAHTERDGRIEVGLIGRFGFVGVPVVLGTMRATARCIMEMRGEALEIRPIFLRQSMDKHSALRQKLLNYVQALLVQHSQTVLCTALHRLEERLARWLLLAHDRLDDNVVPLTHELFATTLGVRRAGVTTALTNFEDMGIVRKRRGAVEIMNRPLLERNACECYRIISGEYRRLIDTDPHALPAPRKKKCKSLSYV